MHVYLFHVKELLHIVCNKYRNSYYLSSLNITIWVPAENSVVFSTTQKKVWVLWTPSNIQHTSEKKFNKIRLMPLVMSVVVLCPLLLSLVILCNVTSYI